MRKKMSCKPKKVSTLSRGLSVKASQQNSSVHLKRCKTPKTECSTRLSFILYPTDVALHILHFTELNERMTYVCLSHEKKEEALPPYLTTEVKGEGPKTNWSPKTSAKTKMGPESLSPCIKALLPLLLCEKSAFEDNKSFLSLCLSHFKERPPSVFFYFFIPPSDGCTFLLPPSLVCPSPKWLFPLSTHQVF